MKISHVVYLCAALAIFAFHTVGGETPTPATFHDIRTLDPKDYVRLIEPYTPEVAKYAARLGTVEQAYKFVNEEVAFVAHLPPAPPDRTLARKQGSCLSKAALLVSLYRALGMPPEAVRIIRGVAMGDRGPLDHVWVDMEYKGQCLQQDPSGLFGSFGFNDFPGISYSDRYVMIENFCFNEKGFALISQLNRMGHTMPGAASKK